MILCFDHGFDDSESPLPLHGLHGVDIVWLPAAPFCPESVHRGALLGGGAHKPDKHRVLMFLSGETFTGALFMLNKYLCMFDIGYS